MVKLAVFFLVAVLFFYGSVMPCMAATKADRVAVEASVKAELGKDLAHSLPDKSLWSERSCLDGRSAADFQGNVIEYWVNLECPYCGIAEPFKAQRDNQGICIVVRHASSIQYGEALKKAISYEALGKFSQNAANRFWEAIAPKTALAIPIPYGSALQTALGEAAVGQEIFAEEIEKASRLVSSDILASQELISSTPTYVLEGIRFPACDFKSVQIPLALELAKKARAGDMAAKSEIVGIITRGLLDEQLL